MQQQSETMVAAAAKLSPPATVLGVQIAGIHVAEWIQWLTLLYILMLVAHKGWQMVREAWTFWKPWTWFKKGGYK